jgi:YYY domain-containing protein
MLALIVAVGAILRFSGLNWDQGTQLHPDERFLTMVEGSIRLPDSLGQYFDTANSPLNPHNAGHTFFVYGTFPIFLVRALVEWLPQTDPIQIYGRAASASFDVISLVLIYLIGARLYSRRVGLLAAAFSSLSVLLIQHAHFFVVDSFANTFILAGIYFAVRALEQERLANFIFFGVSLGLAVASKISSAPLAGVIALAILIRYLRLRDGEDKLGERRALALLATAAFVSLATFRIFQPYAFQGPSILGIIPNSEWIQDIRDVGHQTAGYVDFPPALQWANRTPVLFALGNLILWGLGAPLGILAWAGWGWALYRSAKGEWHRHLIPVVWTGAYFLWRSSGFTPAMRYQLPIYPTLTLMGAWALWEAWERAKHLRPNWKQIARPAIAVVAVGVLAATGTYAIAFARNYTKPLSRVAASRWIYTHIPGAINLVVDTADGELLEPVSVPPDFSLAPGDSYERQFTANLDGTVSRLTIPYVTELGDEPIERELSFNLTEVQATEVGELMVTLGGGVIQAILPPGEQSSLEIPFDSQVTLVRGTRYILSLQQAIQPQVGSAIAMRGSILVNESAWDDAMPWRVDGRDGFGGLYRGASQELYWPDDQDDDADGVSDQLERIVDTLAEAEYLIISSNRQYATTTRVPQRYPLTTQYYRALLGCPAPLVVARCAREAQPGEIQGLLGYELIQVFESNPQLGAIEFADQAAEEAFTVYDHPKVLVFAKTEEFSSQKVMSQLESVDVSRVINAIPRDLGNPGPDLMLPPERLQDQRENGTWSTLFPSANPLNRSQPLAVLAWWAVIAIIGLLAFPTVKAVFPGLSDAGYPLARLIGLLFMAWLSWVAGSFGVPYTQATIFLAIVVLSLISFALLRRQGRSFGDLLRQHRKGIIFTEIVAVGFFTFDLLVRLANPDLWHPSLGGEKPMDFSYLNAVLKSSSFPPYDPWFAGGYINYYYFGFVLVGSPLKLLALNPSVGYNLILPTLFSLSALAAFSLAYNLVARAGVNYATLRRVSPRAAGLAAAVALVLLGNLGTLRMLYDGFRIIGLEGIEIESSRSVGILDAARGFGRYISESDRSLPYALHHWYWNPSRSIPPGEGETGPITEFPYFTFLYGDLHAHLINLPLTILTLAWGTSWLLAAEKGKPRGWILKILTLIVGGLILGALNPTNTWDVPVYWALGAAAAAAGALLRHRRLSFRAILEAAFSAAVLLLFAYFLFRPYYQWYGQAYGSFDLWTGSRTPLDAYLTIHGLYLFIIFAWLIWETRQWMAATPLSRLSDMRPYFTWIAVVSFVLIAVVAYLTGRGFSITPLVIGLILWSVLLFLRGDTPIEKRIVLAMVATGAALTYLVDVVVLSGDIGRMNTVFKFYMQVWTLFSISAAAALVWILGDFPAWGFRIRRWWGLGLVFLVAGALLYSVTATFAKATDRMEASAPNTLDGMEFMQHATWYDQGQALDLSNDYHAIRWMQENVEGSPVIVEANIRLYSWGSRFSIYTGLPSVLGWDWHQRQQRAAVGEAEIYSRLEAITEFYSTRSVAYAQQFLKKYDVRYVVLGDLERLYYQEWVNCESLEDGVNVRCDMVGRRMGIRTLEVPLEQCRIEQGDDRLTCPTHGLEKFDQMLTQGLIKKAYERGDTVIYEVTS